MSKSTSNRAAAAASPAPFTLATGAVRIDAQTCAESIVDADPLRFADAISVVHADIWTDARHDATRADALGRAAGAASVRAAVAFARAYGDSPDLPLLVSESGAPLTRSAAWAALHARPEREKSDPGAASRALAAARVVGRCPEAADIGSVEALADIDRAHRAAIKAQTGDGATLAAARRSVGATERSAVAACRKSGEIGAAAKRTIVGRIDAKRGAETEARDAKKSESAKSARAAASGIDASAIADSLAKALGPGGAGASGIAVALVERIGAEAVASFSATLAAAAASAADPDGDDA